MMTRIDFLTLLLMIPVGWHSQAIGDDDVPEVVTQAFDKDPGWDGFRNRLLPKKLPVVRQDFGYRTSHHAGGEEKGEIGGRVQRADERACYAKSISPKTFKDRLSASGKFSVEQAEGGSGVMIGWFNHKNSHGWRTPDSLVFRIDGNGGKYWLFFEYGTTNRATGGGGAFEGERYQTTATLPFLADGTTHEWSLSYDPNGAGGRGLIRFQVDDRSYEVPLHEGHQKLGATFDRFGILAQQTSGSSLEVYLDDLTIDGEKESFDSDPKWIAEGNHDSYEQKLLRPYHDFGFSQTTHAGGQAGKIGGIIFRDEKPAYYADETGPFNLDQELKASGKLVFKKAGADSGVMLGWFNSEKKKSKKTPEYEVPQTDYLGVYLEGPSRVGHYFRAAYSSSKGTHEAPTGEGTREERPIVIPGDQVHDWSIHYDPEAAGGRGQITIRFDNTVHHLPLREDARKQGATFDRFGLFNLQAGGHHVELYLDDISYSK